METISSKTTNSNHQHLRNISDCTSFLHRRAEMEGQTELQGSKENLFTIKELFQSRHYLRCSLTCKRLLIRTNDETHPIHRAYLNFYLALSHDTMAREAGMRNRQQELDLAEKHYLAAIHSLTSPGSDNQGFHQRPDSSASTEGDDVLRRRPSDVQSIDSDNSASTSPMDSYHEDSERKNGFNPYFAPSSLPEHKLSTEVVTFLNMVRTHLAGVRQLQQSSTTQRFCFSPTRSTSPTASRPTSRASSHAGTSADQPRWRRGSLAVRPRFDPTSIRKLCDEALEEL